MSSEKPRIIFVADKELLKALEDYRWDNRLSRSQAIRKLLREGLEKHSKKRKKS